MNRGTIRILSVIVVALALLLVVLRSSDTDNTTGERPLLLPDFTSVANDIDYLAVQAPGDDKTAALHRIDGRWAVSGRNDYAADVGKLRELIIALADARIVENKTANPAYYSRLGVDDPAQGGTGTRLVVSGPGVSYTLILGNRAQGDFRYARIDGQETSFLIDRYPEIPSSAGDWLLADILDVEATRIRKVSIVHADGETIVVAKDEQEQSDFDVLDIPEGRELSYVTVGNGIAAALGKLSLEDVRRQADSSPIATARFETWNGLSITAEVVAEDDAFWVAFIAAATGDEPESTGEVDAINERLGGWQYQLADHKKNLLMRRWDDILKTEE